MKTPYLIIMTALLGTVAIPATAQEIYIENEVDTTPGATGNMSANDSDMSADDSDSIADDLPTYTDGTINGQRPTYYDPDMDVTKNNRPVNNRPVDNYTGYDPFTTDNDLYDMDYNDLAEDDDDEPYNDYVADDIEPLDSRSSIDVDEDVGDDDGDVRILLGEDDTIIRPTENTRVISDDSGVILPGGNAIITDGD
jgi:hypothetical protein